MKARILTVLTTTTLLVATSGCSGMRNFLFGRGARCGSCLSLPKLPGLGGRGLGSCLTPPAAEPCSVCPPVAIAPPQVYAPAAIAPSAPCGTCMAPPADCGCGVSSSYAPGIVSDPYLSSPPITNSIPANGEIYGGSPVYNGIPSTGIVPNYNAVPNYGSGDNFQSRRFDNDGARILSVDPLPPGVTPAN